MWLSIWPLQTHHCAVTQRTPIHILTEDKVALLSEELTPQGIVIPKENEIALLEERTKGQYSPGKLACSVPFS